MVLAIGWNRPTNTESQTMYINLPFIGRIYVHLAPNALRPSAEILTSAGGKELLLYCGRLRCYLTPARTVAGEGRCVREAATSSH
jgi:hypothetical protein